AGADRHSLRAPKWHSLGDVASRTGLRLRHELLAKVARLDQSGCVVRTPSPAAVAIASSGPNRLVPCGDRLRLGASGFWGAQTGPNPTDRGKAGSKHHVLTDAGGIPLVAKITAANAHDVTQLLPLAVSIPPV